MHSQWYFPIFPSRLAILLITFGHAISTNSISLFDVSSSVRSGPPAIPFLLTGCTRSQKSFIASFSLTFPHSHHCIPLCIFREKSIFYSFTAHFTANTFKVLLCRLTYSVPPCSLHPDKRGCMISVCSPHNLHLSHSTHLFPCSCFYYFFL